MANVFLQESNHVPEENKAIKLGWVSCINFDLGDSKRIPLLLY
jgi:hypothetical protein